MNNSDLSTFDLSFDVRFWMFLCNLIFLIVMIFLCDSAGPLMTNHAHDIIG